MGNVLLHPLFVTRIRETIFQQKAAAIDGLDQIISVLSGGKSDPEITQLLSDCERVRDVLAKFDPQADGAGGDLGAAKALMRQAGETIARMQASRATSTSID